MKNKAEITVNLGLWLFAFDKSAEERIDEMYEILNAAGLCEDLEGGTWANDTRISSLAVVHPTEEGRAFLKEFFCSRGFELHSASPYMLNFENMEYKAVQEWCRDCMALKNWKDTAEENEGMA